MARTVELVARGAEKLPRWQRANQMMLQFTTILV